MIYKYSMLVKSTEIYNDLKLRLVQQLTSNNNRLRKIYVFLENYLLKIKRHLDEIVKYSLFSRFRRVYSFLNQSTANYALRANLRVAKSISRLAARGVLAANWVGLS